MTAGAKLLIAGECWDVAEQRQSFDSGHIETTNTHNTVHTMAFIVVEKLAALSAKRDPWNRSRYRFVYVVRV